MKSQLTIEVYRERNAVYMGPDGGPRVRIPGDYRWRIRHRNGRIMADSGEGYRRRSSCLKAIATLKAGFRAAGIKDLG